MAAIENRVEYKWQTVHLRNNISNNTKNKITDMTTKRATFIYIKKLETLTKLFNKTIKIRYKINISKYNQWHFKMEYKQLTVLIEYKFHIDQTKN